MIKSNNVEKGLHSWLPWCSAVDEGRQQTQVITNNGKNVWSYAGEALKAIALPPDPLLRLYFLACIFSEYKHGDNYYYDEIKLPASLCQALRRLQGFPVKLRYLLNEELTEKERRPIPPEIWSRQDVEFYQNSIKIKFNYFIVLSRHHPLRQIGSKKKRSIDIERARLCAQMKDSGISYAEINSKFGWKPQKNSYGQKIRYPTAYRYVASGRKLLSAHEMKVKNNLGP